MDTKAHMTSRDGICAGFLGFEYWPGIGWRSEDISLGDYNFALGNENYFVIKLKKHDYA